MTGKIASALDLVWNESSRFDYVDRVILTFFLAWNLIITIYVLDQHLSVTDQRELVPAIDLMGYLLVFFFLWPLLYLTIEKIAMKGYVTITGEAEQ